MINKKNFLFYSLLLVMSCFFCIDKVNAYNYRGVELNQEFFNKGWEVLNGTNNGGANYYQEDFPYVICSYATNSGGQIRCFFVTDYEFWSQYAGSITIKFENTLNKYVYAPGFIYYINDKRYVSNRANNIGVTNTVTNFEVYNGSTLVKSKDFDYDPGPVIFEYENTINTNLIDSIEFKFDDLPLSETNIVYEFEFQSVLSDGNNSINQIPQPFGREYYTGCDEDSQSCSSTLKSKDYLFYDLDNISTYYEYIDGRTFNDDPDRVTSSYSVIMPLDKDIGKYVKIHFVGTSEFDVIINYKEDEGSTFSYLETIDITNKYGVVFLPWYDNSIYVDNNSYYLTDFKVQGNIDIQLTDSRDTDKYNILQIYSMNYCNNTYLEQKEIPYSCDNLSGVFRFKIDNLTANQTLRFVNHSYSNGIGISSKITYDTRYFNYVVLDTPYSIGEIIDPVTGQKENVNLKDFYNQLDKYSSVGFKSALNRFLEPIKFIFKCITKLFQSFLNASLQDYFTVAFSLMIIILILRVIF